MSAGSIGRNLIEDLRHSLNHTNRTGPQVLLWGLARAVFQARFRIIFLFRLSQLMFEYVPTRLVARLIHNRILRIGGADLHPGARIGPGLILMHTPGIVIGHEVEAGSNLVIYQGVTLGHDKRGAGQPRLGNDVKLGAGAKILGPISIGHGCQVGANAVVLADVPAGSTVVGIWKG